jgi:bifunctional oligoribonuclease and PAP phosphatase NrnA
MIPALLDAIEKNHTFLVTTHENPDGDAVGSSLGLASFLRNAGKEVTIHFKDPVPDLYRFLPLADQVLDTVPDRPYDICFVLDVGEFRRAGEAVTTCRTIGSFINIDHHITRDLFGAINYIDSAAAATGVLIYRIIKASGQTLDYDTALCLYTAVLTDTGSFRYSNANPEAFTVAGDLVGYGINAWFVAEHLYESQPAGRLKLLAEALATLIISPRGDVASVTVTLDMYERTGTNAELTDGFVNYPRSIRGVEVAIFFREIKPCLFKVGFRSKGGVNVSALAELFCGGGHHNAAGCNVEGSIEEVRKTVLSRVYEALAA